MALQQMQNDYIFPRIPLKLKLPETYPDVRNISNISVIPIIKYFKMVNDELEIQGDYEIAVSYFKQDSQIGQVSTESEKVEQDEFFSQIILEPDGLFNDTCHDLTSDSVNKSPELYTVHFSRTFHTFVDLEFVKRPRQFKPCIKVKEINLRANGGRLLQGDLVLRLTNTSRGRPLHK